jgi:hypothetical protein
MGLSAMGSLDRGTHRCQQGPTQVAAGNLSVSTSAEDLNHATQDVDPDDGLGHNEGFGDDMWEKLVDMLHLSYINIGGFGISRNA